MRVGEDDIYRENRKRGLANWATRTIKEGRYLYTVGPFEEVLWMLVALEGEGIQYKLLRYESGHGDLYCEIHPYDGSSAMERAKVESREV